jgi:hypothetical protein
VDPSTAEVLRILDEVRTHPIPTGPVKLNAGYRHWVEVAESVALAPGRRDKTWVRRLLRQAQDLTRNARRVR